MEEERTIRATNLDLVLMMKVSGEVEIKKPSYQGGKSQTARVNRFVELGFMANLYNFQHANEFILDDPEDLKKLEPYLYDEKAEYLIGYRMNSADELFFPLSREEVLKLIGMRDAKNPLECEPFLLYEKLCNNIREFSIDLVDMKISQYKSNGNRKRKYEED